MDLNVWIALWAGVLSFISPCCLPLYPSFLSYISGVSVHKLQADASTRLRVLAHSILFTLGFSLVLYFVFYTLGFGAGLISDVFVQYRNLISKIAAIIIILMGLFLMGIFQPQLLMKEFKMKMKLRSAGYVSSFLIGMGFAAGWSPCVGPILSAIVALAASEPGTWFQLITAYNIGFSVPFIVLAFFIGSARWLLRYSNLIMKIGGAIMVLVGILLYTGQLVRITIWLNSITPEWMMY